MEEDKIICSSLTKNKLLTATVNNSKSMILLHLPLDAANVVHIMHTPPTMPVRMGDWAIKKIIIEETSNYLLFYLLRLYQHP
jgi:hypothetical protein